ncbi:MAG: NUDIX domain protein [Verrucomicrobia bacterium ADurb.Bin122]|nr:MAG: NUDIX domain protein [Verrucomicrobia bacterium ADurb.Bin122]
MHRAAALSLLRGYLAGPLESGEAEMGREIVRFVETHEDCFLRSCLSGHLTGSAWIVNAARTQTLLTHHRKLDRWLQLGGHADGETDLAQVAMREAREESGLTELRLVAREPFDVDRHWIPERGDVPGHRHLDLRFLVEGDPAAACVVSHESKALAWVPLAAVAELNPSESMVRLVKKTLRYC